jgi:hypothetical protein
MYMGRLKEKTPVANLFLTGAWVMGGGMSAAMLSGRSVAQAVLAAISGSPQEKMIPDAPEEEIAETLPQESAGDAPLRTAAKVPAKTLVAVGSGREMPLDRLGVPAVLVFHSQENAGAAGRLNQAVRERYPLPSQVLIASVANLQGVPRLFRGMAEGAMRKAYQEASAQLPEGLKAEDYVIILPDWDGKVTEALGAKDPDKVAAVAVIDGAGALLGFYQGDSLEEKALQFLQNLLD